MACYKSRTVWISDMSKRREAGVGNGEKRKRPLVLRGPCHLQLTGKKE